VKSGQTADIGGIATKVDLTEWYSWRAKCFGPQMKNTAQRKLPLQGHQACLPHPARLVEIDEFVPRKEIDDLYLVRPYYIVPDGKVGHDAYAVIRDTIRSLDQGRARARRAHQP
jgi:hypothetical protein